MKHTGYAWLIEKGTAGGTTYRDIDDNGLMTWTKDAYQAIHFKRRVDAEKFANGDEEDIRITEHGFEYE